MAALREACPPRWLCISLAMVSLLCLSLDVTGLGLRIASMSAPLAEGSAPDPSRAQTSELVVVLYVCALLMLDLLPLAMAPLLLWALPAQGLLWGVVCKAVIADIYIPS